MKINSTVSNIFETISKANPDLPALIHMDKKYTYSALNHNANALASFLIKRNISSGDFICIYLEPGYEFILCLISIIKCGAVYIPLDTLAPQNRIQDIIEDAHPKLIITSKNYLSLFKTSKHNLFFIEDTPHLETSTYSKDLKLKLRPESPMCLMYTSGSTGKPKGVVIPNRAVINVATDNAINIQANSKMAQFGNLAFDGSTYDIWTTLLNKGALVIIKLGDRFDSQKLSHVLMHNKITHIFLPTGYLHQVVSSQPETLDGVNSILFGGEPINVSVIKRFLRYRTSKNLPILLINGYGPTETTCYVCRNIITQHNHSDEQLISIGKAIQNTELYVLDPNLRPSQEGELYISGANLALGYHNSPILNKEKFIKNPFSTSKLFSRLYKTGDIVKKLKHGELLYIGRSDDQVKINGFRVHLKEIEEELQKHESIVMASVVVEMGGEQHKILSAYIVFKPGSNIIHADEIRNYLNKTLPPYMIPVKFHKVDDLPLTVTGKIDKKILHALPFIDLTYHLDVSSENELEEIIKSVWKHLLNRQSIEVNKNLFDLGANSLLISEACTQINQKIHANLKISDILAFPTIQKLAYHLQGTDSYLKVSREKVTNSDNKIAIVGMSVRLPKATNLTEFWNNLCLGKDCLTRFDDLEQSKDTHVSVKGILDDIEQFDEAFFKYTPAEARITDPQHRIYLECVWEALEHAGIIPSKATNKLISVFSGMSDSTYLYENILKNKKSSEFFDKFQYRIATSMGTLSTQISYRLNLKGKSLNVNTACSTGLVTVAQACRDLSSGDSDIALAGASSIVVPQLQSYKYTPGSILSPDGYCRPFSNQANGTVFSNGVAVVVLKRLKDALADKDTIYAVIEGCGINNDGDDKLSFTAPSLNGQAECIKDALKQANLHPQDIGFIEAHGTGTALGDVIEFNALTSVFNESTTNKHFCALGSVKANIGHTDVAAGIIGLIKAVLCIYHKKIPPLIHFQKPNSNLSFEDSPFFVNTSLIDWKSKFKRHAGVSSFGVGGTNAHIILSEHKHSKISSEPTNELILLSAKTEVALNQQTEQFLTFMNSSATSTKVNISDIAFTLQTGREDFQWRTFTVGEDIESIIESLPHKTHKDSKLNSNHSINFLFSGQGTQYATMCVNLIKTIPRFKKYIKEGCHIAHQYLKIDLFSLLQEKQTSLLNQTQYAQPALFIIEYALAQLLMDCGIVPTALIGHSFGEYVAACIAKAFSYEDGVFLSCKRGELMAQTASGRMLAVNCTLKESIVYQERFDIETALHNTPTQFVFAGLPHHIIKLQDYLKKNNQPYKLLRVQHAFHSKLMEPIKESFLTLFTKINISAPSIQLISNVTGDWLSEHEIRNPLYWYQHLRSTVQYTKGTQLILKDKHPLFIEVGPGNTLLHFTKQIANKPIEGIQTLPGYLNSDKDRDCFLNALGSVWIYGLNINFKPLHEDTKHQHVALPTYPFQKNKHWIDPTLHISNCSEVPHLYKPVWSKRMAYLTHSNLQKQLLSKYDWIIFKDQYGIANNLISLLRNAGIQPTIIHFNSKLFLNKDKQYYIDGTNKEHYMKLFKSLKDTAPNLFALHCASLFNEKESEGLNNKVIDSLLDNGFYSLMYLAQAFTTNYPGRQALSLTVITNGLMKIQGEEKVYPPNAAIQGAAMVIMQENPNIHIKIFDINFDENILKNENITCSILKDCVENDPNTTTSFLLAYRNGYAWHSHLINSHVTSEKKNPLKDNGVYLITGGLGGIAQNCCEMITKTIKHPSLILLTRRKIPVEHEWEQISHTPNHSLHKEISFLINLKNLGAQLFLYQIDISKKDELKGTINSILSSIGAIDGVIHTAGEAAPSPLMQKLKTNCHSTFIPKIHGTYNLIHALQQTHIDFIVLISSLSSLMGGFGLVDYSAANASLDAFVDTNLFPFADFVQSINWNTWQQTGLTNKHSQNFLNNENEITPYEGQELFLKALTIAENHIAISKMEPIYKRNSVEKQSVTPYKRNKSLIESNNIGLNGMEKKMISLWQDALGIKNIDLNDDFFSLGGHSLLALNLIDKINHTFNWTLHSNQLHKTSTIKTLIKEVESNKLNDSKDILIPLKITSNKPPFLFLFHPINGLLFCFNSLITESNFNFSIYGFQDSHLKNKKIQYNSLLDIAQNYLQEIIKIQPHGPYFFLGYSFGGNVCYEVAALLKQREEKIAFLGMIDSWALNPQIGKTKQRFNQFMSSINMQHTPELLELTWKRQKLLLQHNISYTSQEIVLFKAKELLKEYQSINDTTNGWAQYTNNNVIYHVIPGNHHSIMELKSIQIISKLLTKYF